MPRHVLPEALIHPAIGETVACYHESIVQKVQEAIKAHAVVVLGMKQNPYPRKARKALDAAGVAYHYIEYGSYFNQWRRRTVLKMWTGWPTLPMIFVKGVLVGGADDLIKLMASGEFATMLR